MIRVQDLVKTFPGSPAPVLRGLSLEIPSGAFVTVMGGSGCGKSTLLRCLVGLEPFDAGLITVEQTTVRGTSASTPSERKHAVSQLRSSVGIVFQSFELFPHLTALQNCTIAPVQVQRRSRKDAEALAAQRLEQLGLGAKLHVYPDMLSGGQKQRVAIARALCLEPRLLLYDEPTSALDPSLRAEVADTLRGIRDQGVTQIVVTHDVSMARASDCLYVLSAGRVAESGEPARLFRDPATEETRRLLAGE